MIDERGVSFFHRSDVLQSQRVGNAVPGGSLVVDEVIPTVAVGLGFQQPAGHGGDYERGERPERRGPLACDCGWVGVS
jgi:hypothetical protein